MSNRRRRFLLCKMDMQYCKRVVWKINVVVRKKKPSNNGKIFCLHLHLDDNVSMRDKRAVGRHWLHWSPRADPEFLLKIFSALALVWWPIVKGLKYAPQNIIPPNSYLLKWTTVPPGQLQFSEPPFPSAKRRKEKDDADCVVTVAHHTWSNLWVRHWLPWCILELWKSKNLAGALTSPES